MEQEKREFKRVELPLNLRIKNARHFFAAKNIFSFLFSPCEIEGSLVNISSGGMLIRTKKNIWQRFSGWTKTGVVIVQSFEPMLFELKTPKNTHLTKVEFFPKHIKITPDYLYIGGKFKQNDLMLWPMANCALERNALILSW